MKKSVLFSRRKFIVISSAAIISPSVTFAANKECNAISKIIINAQSEAGKSTLWATTTAQQQIQKQIQRISDFEIAFDLALKKESNQSILQTISYANALGNIAFFVAGIGGSVSLPILIAGSVVFSGAIIIANTSVEAQLNKSIDFKTVGVERVGAVLNAMGDDAFALSKNSIKTSAIASNILGVLSVYDAMSGFSNVNKQFRILTLRRDEISTKLSKARLGLEELKKQAVAEKVRRDCMLELVKDLKPVESLICRRKP